MKVQVQYLNDQEGNVTAGQIHIEDWEKFEKEIIKLGNAFQLNEDLKEAFDEVKQIREGKIPKDTLSDFLNEV